MKASSKPVDDLVGAITANVYMLLIIAVFVARILGLLEILCLSLFPWANFRQTKGAVKLHLLLDHDGYLPDFAVIKDGKTADFKATYHK
jgi:hypothetical protein